MEPKPGPKQQQQQSKIKTNEPNVAVIRNGYDCGQAEYTRFTEFAIKFCSTIQIELKNCKLNMRIWANNNNGLLKIWQTTKGKRGRSQRMNNIMVLCFLLCVNAYKNKSICLPTWWFHILMNSITIISAYAQPSAI